MFILFWTNEKISVALGEAGRQYCPICDAQTPFLYTLTYSYTALYGIFGILSVERIYHILCVDCDKAAKVISADDVPADLVAQAKIPFLHQWGFLCAATAGILAAILFVGFLAILEITRPK